MMRKESVTSWIERGLIRERNKNSFDMNVFIDLKIRRYPLWENVYFKLEIRERSKGSWDLESNRTCNKRERPYRLELIWTRMSLTGS
jgi:hypothetical protein